MQTFDLLVIGSGPAGQRAAIQGAKLGKRVGVIERREVVGGVCVNTGTIPSKTCREAVLHLSGYYYQNVYGVNYRVKEKINMADLAFRVQHVIKTEIDVIQAQLSRNNIELITGIATFTDPHTVRFQNSRGGQAYSSEAIIIATPGVSHVEIGVRALKQNLAVLLEKPIAPSASAAVPLLAAARRSTGFVMPGPACARR